MTTTHRSTPFLKLLEDVTKACEQHELVPTQVSPGLYKITVQSKDGRFLMDSQKLPSYDSCAYDILVNSLLFTIGRLNSGVDVDLVLVRESA